MASTAEHASVDMTMVIMPTSWPHAADTWLLLLEAQYFVHKVTSKFAKFAILTQFPTEDASTEFSDTPIRPSAKTPDDDLENDFLQRLLLTTAGRVTKPWPQTAGSFTVIITFLLLHKVLPT